MDTCDKCGARSYVKVIIDTGGILTFCAHHADQYEDDLSPYVIATEDTRHELAHR